MFKKYVVLLGISLCAMLLVGCEEVRDLTDEETSLIAEYAAEMLLQYDVNYVDRIDEGNEQAEEMAKEQKQDDSQQNTEVEKEDSTTENKGNEETPDATEVVEDNPIGSESDIAVIADIEGAEITYKDYLITDDYPMEDGEGDQIFFEASEGYELLILYFDVVNNTEDVLEVSLLDKELDYHIVCNGDIAANPMLTILMNDLSTLKTNIEPDEKQEAVLIFQVSKGMKEKLETMELYIHYKDMDNMLKILQ